MTPNNGNIPYFFHIIPVFRIPSIPKTDQYLGSMEQKWIPNTDLICRYAVCSIHLQLNDPNIEINPCCVSKILKMTSMDLGNQCFKTCSWIPLTMVKPLLLNSALLEIRIPAQLLIVHMQVHYWKKNSKYTYCLRNPLTFADSAYFLWNLLTVAESRTTCYIWNPQQNKSADKIYVTG